MNMFRLNDKNVIALGYSYAEMDTIYEVIGRMELI
jgi:hypothetical protein